MIESRLVPTEESAKGGVNSDFAEISASPPAPKSAGATDALHITRIAQESKLPVKGVMAVAQLLGEGATVPFIARYRKEATGELDEVQITTVRDRLEQLRELDARRATILKSLEENKHLTPELKASVEAAATLTRLEDIYAPYRPKRRTRATIARERGLEALADFLFDNQAVQPDAEAAKYIAPEKEVPDAAAALAGACDIIAERVSDDASARAACRELFLKEAELVSDVIKGKETEGAKFKDYFEWAEPLASAPSHRILAIRRGEKEGVLFFRLIVPEEKALIILEKLFISAEKPAVAAAGETGPRTSAMYIRDAIADSWKRLLGPSLETEARIVSKKRADDEAIRVFAANISELLMAPALGQKNTLAIDPGFRTGCKVVVLDAQGKLIEHDVIFPTTGSKAQIEEASNRVRILCHKHKVQAIAIGNGTASRETDTFVRTLGLPADAIAIVSVNESGASIYSASEVAREEFPNEDVTVRGSVSIGRRLQDPLAELVKLDPKSIGVGQYQHDVDQGALKRSLDDVVVSCVNRVGVELNTASKQLLSYVSGLNASIAGNIVAWRNEHGAFKSREDLKKVPRLGPKAFEQCAGFLRLRDGGHPLDASAVHPERYPLVEQMACDAGVDVLTLMRDGKARARIDLKNYISESVGLPTLQDILKELEKPGRDPREKFENFSFADGVHDMKDLKEGQRLPGIITNVTAFGAFVDIGVHQDGLLHVSQMADHFVKDPAEIVKVGQKVSVVVTEVDISRKRIGLSMRTNPQKEARSLSDTTGRNAPPRNSSTSSGNSRNFNNPFGSLGDFLR
ncbi:MAG: RNA-binding transcriptional accessory protein [Puniceicoccales bacterium]|nr:RNA-binding transcriptional accessory protein [Puniceicoccales bacterium]